MLQEAWSGGRQFNDCAIWRKIAPENGLKPLYLRHGGHKLRGDASLWVNYEPFKESPWEPNQDSYTARDVERPP